MTGTAPARHEETFDWAWDGQDITYALTRQGAGPRALLLPALSSISTREEMAPLQAQLSERFETLAPDWPGFGTDDKPRVAWTPAVMAAWLDDVLSRVAPDPAMIVAAGHAAGYLLRHFAGDPARAPQLALVAPTWRGPLPTMMGRRPGWLARVRAAVDMPVSGPALYALNLNALVIRRMATGHVYADPAWLTPARMDAKRRVSRAAGARFASVRFVTGALDPFEAGDDARSAAGAMSRVRVQMIWDEETPRKSKVEMEALAVAAEVTPTVLPYGKLGLHEEFAGDVAQAVFERPSHQNEGAKDDD